MVRAVTPIKVYKFQFYEVEGKRFYSAETLLRSKLTGKDGNSVRCESKYRLLHPANELIQHFDAMLSSDHFSRVHVDNEIHTSTDKLKVLPFFLMWETDRGYYPDFS